MCPCKTELRWLVLVVHAVWRVAWSLHACLVQWVCMHCYNLHISNNHRVGLEPWMDAGNQLLGNGNANNSYPDIVYMAYNANDLL